MLDFHNAYCQYCVSDEYNRIGYDNFDYSSAWIMPLIEN